MIPYLSNGYLSMGDLISHAPPFSFIWGGRGIGKTFGALDYVRNVMPQKFIILRRTQKQVDLLKKLMFSPFKAIDEYRGNCTAVVKDGDAAVFYDGQMENDSEVPAGTPLGYMLALSTVHNIRGFDLSDVDILIFDEFIPEAHERPISDEYNAFLNAVETIARNRELKGKQPLKVVALSNSNTITNPYFVGMGVMRTVYRMMSDGIEEFRDDDRGLWLVNILRSPISDAKQGTALYRLAGAGAFADSALGNQFVSDSIAEHRKIPIKECRPLVHVGEICVYEHKFSECLYVTDHVSGSPEHFKSDSASLQQFRSKYIRLCSYYMQNIIVFDTALSESIFRLYMKF